MNLIELTDIQQARASQRVLDVAALEAQGQALVAAFKALPLIVTEPGDYRTRDGRRVTIHTVREGGVSGSVWTELRGKLAPRGIRVWNRNGRVGLFVERNRDIVGRWS